MLTFLPHMLHSVLIYWTSCQPIKPIKLSPHPSPSPLCIPQKLSSQCFLKYSSFWLLLWISSPSLKSPLFVSIYSIFTDAFDFPSGYKSYFLKPLFRILLQVHFREGNCSESSWSWCFICAEKFSITNLTFSRDYLFTDLVGLDLA